LKPKRKIQNGYFVQSILLTKKPITGIQCHEITGLWEFSINNLQQENHQLKIKNFNH